MSDTAPAPSPSSQNAPALFRAAHEVRARLLDLRRARWDRLADQLAGLRDRIEFMESARRRLALCADRGLERAAGLCLSEIEPSLHELEYQVRNVQHALRNDPAPVPSVRDLFREIEQLQEEFGEATYRRRERTLSVVTEPIDLEGVPLGPFEIALPLGALGDLHRGPVYDVTALAPNPAGGNDGITHPHVHDGRLCAGDAWAAVQAALREGRLCDFFVLVRSVLSTYNPDSPFVRLEDWHGISCLECGYSTGDDNLVCRICEGDFCSECATLCDVCEETTCRNCLESCPVCDVGACRACLTRCPECGRRLCRVCLEEEECPCREENADEQDPESPQDGEREGDPREREAESAEPGEREAEVPVGGGADGPSDEAALLADGVGQAALPAR